MCESFCCSALLPIFGIVHIYLFEELYAPYIGDPPSPNLLPEPPTDGRVVGGRVPVPAPRSRWSEANPSRARGGGWPITSWGRETLKDQQADLC